MMQVNLKKCTGCGECLAACPVEAVTLAAGKVFIHVDACLACGSCMSTCPEGAISEARLPVPIRMADVLPVKVNPSRPVLVSGSESRFAWTRTVLSFIGYEIMPRLADAFVATLDGRLSNPSMMQATFNPATAGQINHGRRQVRRRRRGRAL